MREHGGNQRETQRHRDGMFCANLRGVPVPSRRRHAPTLGRRSRPPLRSHLRRGSSCGRRPLGARPVRALHGVGQRGRKAGARGRDQAGAVPRDPRPHLPRCAPRRPAALRRRVRQREVLHALQAALRRQAGAGGGLLHVEQRRQLRDAAARPRRGVVPDHLPRVRAPVPDADLAPAAVVDERGSGRGTTLPSNWWTGGSGRTSGSPSSTTAGGWNSASWAFASC